MNWGYHWSPCRGGGGNLSALAGLLVLAAVCAVLDKILHVLEDALVITGIVAACGILSIAAVAILGVVHRMRSEHLMTVSIGPPPRETLTATVIPQVGEGAMPRAIEHHVIHHHVWEGPAMPDAALIARSAIPGDAGEIIYEER